MMSANDQILAVKLGYEWKNIYRLLAQRNNQSETQDHLIEVDEFDKICQQLKVHLCNDELRNLVKQHAVVQLNRVDSNEAEITNLEDKEEQAKAPPVINFKELS